MDVLKFENLRKIKGGSGGESKDVIWKYIQSAPLDKWVIDHQLGNKNFIVVPVNDNREILYGDVNHIDDNSLTVDFNTPVSGMCILILI